MPNQLRATTWQLNIPVDREVLTVAAARTGLPGILRRFRADPDAEPVLVGSHRKADGAVVPMHLYHALRAGSSEESRPVLDFLSRRRHVISRLAAMSRIEAVAVFGSAARGEETPDSDVDFLVDPNDNASLFDLAQFAEDMEELLARPVDIVSRRGLDPERDRMLLAEAVPL